MKKITLLLAQIVIVAGGFAYIGILAKAALVDARKIVPVEASLATPGRIRYGQIFPKEVALRSNRAVDGRKEETGKK